MSAMPAYVRAALEQMRKAEMQLDDLDYLTESSAYEVAMAAARVYHAALDRWEREQEDERTNRLTPWRPTPTPERKPDR